MNNREQLAMKLASVTRRLHKAERDYDKIVQYNYRLVVWMKASGIDVPSYEEVAHVGRSSILEYKP